ncbi:MAG: deoxyribonuclease IV, partial [Novibacillus thermophilus]
AEIALLSDNAEKRFGERFLDDVEKLKSFFNKQSIQPQEFVAKTWEALKGQKQKNADKREPMERLYDLVVSEQLFKDYTEEAINHRLIAVLAERK